MAVPIRFQMVDDCRRAKRTPALRAALPSALVMLGIAAAMQMTTVQSAAAPGTLPAPPPPVPPAPPGSATVIRIPSGHIERTKGPYRLGPRDVIGVIVEEHPEFSDSNIVVPADGRISLPPALSFFVIGKTTAQVQAEVRRRLMMTRLRDPRVTVSVRSMRPAAQSFINIVGDVVRQGIVQLDEDWRLTEAMSAVGGVPGRLDETRATLTRGRTSIPINLHEALSRPYSKANLRLRPNDVISVMRIAPVTVIGAVIRPNDYGWRSASTLVDAISAAGGPRQAVEASRGYIVRKGQKIDVNIKEAFAFRDSTANVALRPGDFLTVEAVPPLNVSVAGDYANAPGYYQVEEGSGVLQAIVSAKGLKARPDEISATIWRGGAVLPVDLQRLWNGSDPAANIPLQNGDVVNLAEPKVIRVRVTGRVNKPEQLRLPPEATLMDALVQAGGPAIPRELARISVLRRDENGEQVVLQIDVPALFDMRDMSQNPRLRDGDLVTVSEAKIRTVIVSGEVLKPGPYPINDGDGVPELLARSGHTLLSALTRVVVRRGNEKHEVDVYDVLRRGGDKPNFPLQDGDFVVVPRNEARVLVMNAVVNPNYYPLPERGTLTAIEALTLAGGPRQGAKIKEIAVLRKQPDGSVARIPVPLNEIGKGQISAASFVLRNGDILFVPEMGTPRAGLMQQATQAVGMLGLLRSLPF